MNEKIIQIDIDGVLRDFITSSYVTLEKFYPKKVPLEEPIVTEWDFNVYYPLFEKSEFFNLIFHSKLSKYIFRYNALPYDGAKLFLRRLRKHGFTIILNTHQNNNSLKYTLGWLSDNNMSYDGIFSTQMKNKAIIPYGYLVDDMVENLTSDRGILVTQPWNKEKSFDGLRVNTSSSYKSVDYNEIFQTIQHVYEE